MPKGKRSSRKKVVEVPAEKPAEAKRLRGSFGPYWDLGNPFAVGVYR